MKRFLVSAIAISALAACSTTPDYTSTKPADPRNPATFDSVSQSAEILAQASADLVNVSLGFSNFAWDGSKKVAGGSWKLAKGSATGTKNAVIIGWGLSQNSSAVVLASAESLSRASDKISRNIVTTSGDIFEASVDTSGKFIMASVEVVKDSGKAVVWVGKKAVGFISATPELISRAAQWSSEKSESALRLSVNVSGEVVDASGKVFGYVVDASGAVVNFVVDKSGKILRISEDISVAVIHGSSDASKQFARDAKEALTASGTSASAVVTMSAQGTVWFVKWTSKQSAKSAKFIVGKISDIIHAEPETGTPVNPTPY